MRLCFPAALAASLLIALAGCVQQKQEAGPIGHPAPIIVRDFSFSPGIVTLDPSFGFSLYRGSPGVPPRERAASVGRAAAFNVADAIVTQLENLGYDAIRSDNGGPEPGARALIVSGAFLQINEGQRRRVGAENASVLADVEIAYQTAGAAPQRLNAMQLDSRQTPLDGGIIGASTGRASNVQAAAARLGRTIARYVGDLARNNNWPAAPR